MADRLTILLTNIWLANRAGSETVVRDLALGLLRRGHRPIVYSPSLGRAADDLLARGVVVIDDLRKLAEAPDILHGHHVVPCGEALYRFPDLPAIQTCHSFAHWAEAPAHFPQIAVYVAVDEPCRDRLVQSEGIDPRRVLLMPNAVDLTRIPHRPRPLSPQPRRAVAFGKAAVIASTLGQACEQLGIEFEAIGTLEHQLAEPERELVRADLVFASARSALESLCCGCAVLVCDFRGMACLVTSDNFDDLRRQNFGLRLLTEPVSVETCIREIRRYDPADAARVSARARSEADLEKQLDQFEALYRDVLTGSRRPIITRELHDRAMARFLHEHLPRHSGDVRWPWLGEREALSQQIQNLETRLGEARERLTSANQEMDAKSKVLDERLEKANQEIDAKSKVLDECLEKMERERFQGLRDLAETRACLSETSGKLAVLRRSRLLKFGRFARRMFGLPTAY